MNIDVLRAKLEELKLKDLPLAFVVCINFGTTIGGAIDDIFKIR
jgi:hypothetical protein